MKNSTLLMVGILAAVAMLSAVVVLPMQQASAEDTILSFKIRQRIVLADLQQ
jgi:hypothetical protein